MTGISNGTNGVYRADSHYSNMLTIQMISLLGDLASSRCAPE
jgi:hypothetical protein